MKELILALLNKLNVDKKWRNVVVSILVALGLGGGTLVAVQSQSLGPIWPTYTDRLCSTDGQICPAWLATAGGHLQSYTDDAWIGRSATNNIAFDAGNQRITETVAGDTYSAYLILENADGSGRFYTPPGYTQTLYSQNIIGGLATNNISCFDTEATEFGCGSNTLFGGAVQTLYLPGFPVSTYLYSNIITATASENSSAGGNTISGGFGNVVLGRRSVIGGGTGNTIGDNANYTNDYAQTISGGTGNTISSTQPTNVIAGGGNNSIQGSSSGGIIGGGLSNHIYGSSGNAAILSGQTGEITDSENSIICGVEQNTIENMAESILCSSDSWITATIADTNSGIFGGDSNTVLNSSYSTIIGGALNSISSADYALVAGRRAKANHDGAFVWADSTTDADFASSLANQFNVRAVGGEVQAAGWFAAANDAQESEFVIRRQATHSDATWYTLFRDGSSLRLSVPSNGLWNADIQLVGLTSGAPQRFAYNLQCSVVNDGGTTTLLSTNTDTLSESDANYDARCTGNNTNDSLDIEVQNNGGTSYTVRWVAIVRIAQVIY